MSRALVVDASVAVQLLLEEEASASIEDVLSDTESWHPLIAPTILVSETAAAISKNVRRRQISIASAQTAFQTWSELITRGPFTFFPANDLIEEAFEMSLDLHHALHDCIYLALARSQSAALATRDTVLARKAQQIGIRVELSRARLNPTGKAGH